MHSSKETNKYYHKNYFQFFHFCFAFFGTFLHAFGSIFDTNIKALKITSDREKKYSKDVIQGISFPFSIIFIDHLCTHSLIVKHTNFFLRPSAFCSTSASRPRNGVFVLSLQVNPNPASKGVSSCLKS